MLKMQVIGHIGRDAVINESNGNKVINFSVAHSEKYKDAHGAEVNKTIWVSCSYWNERTNVAQYLKKGTLVYLEGIPNVKMYKAADGSTRADLILRVHSIQLLGGKPKEDDSSTNNNSSANANKAIPDANDITEPIDDLPF